MKEGRLQFASVYGSAAKYNVPFPAPTRRNHIKWGLRFSLLANIFLVMFMFQYHLSPKTDVDFNAAVEVRVIEKVVEKSIEVPVPIEKDSSRRCGMCDVNPGLCEELGADNVARALGYMGSNIRLRRVLAKMRRGEPFTVGVIGGSVSKGHGIKDHHIHYAPQNMHRRIFNWLDEKFPGKAQAVMRDSGKAKGANGFVNGAQGGLGSEYFSMCFREHITDDVDLVLVELAINDERLLKSQESYELLLRGLLDLPGEPAIINLQVLALIFDNLSLGGDMHAGLAEYYDIPTISLRNLWLHQILQNYTVMEEVFHPEGMVSEVVRDGYDQRHLGVGGHRVLSDLVTTYLDVQLCEMDRIEASAKNKNIDALYPRQALPRIRALDKFDKNKVMPAIHPNCFSTNAVKSLLVPSENQGWRNWSWEEKKYIIADKPGAHVAFEFETALGNVELFYQRSAKYGLGNVRCWVDDEKDKSTIIEGWWNLKYNIGRSTVIRKDLPVGKHVLHCELLEKTADPGGGREFRIISVMSV